SAVALWFCSFIHRSAASFHVRFCRSPSLCSRQDSDLSLSWSSCASALLPVPVDCRTRSPLAVTKSIHQNLPRLRSDILQLLYPKSLATLAEEKYTATSDSRSDPLPGTPTAAQVSQR